MTGGSSYVGEELGELVERALRQRGGDGRHEQRVGGAEHALAGQRDARRAVEDRDVVQVGDRFQQRREAPGRALRVVEVEVEVAQREVGRNDVEPGVIGRVDVGRERRLVADEALDAALDDRLDAEAERRRALRVEVPEQHPGARAGRLVGEVDGRGGLADAAFDAVRGEDLHHFERVERGAQGPPGGLGVVGGEALGELGARGEAALVEPLAELADGEHRGR